MAPTLPRLTLPGAVPSSSSPSAGSKIDVVIILSSDDEQEASSLKSAGFKPEVITLSSSSDEEQEASSGKMSSSVGSKAGPVDLTSSSDGDAELLANCRKRRAKRYVQWPFPDEFKILTALAAERHESGRLPDGPPEVLRAILSRFNELKRKNLTARQVSKKVHNLKDKFKKAIVDGGPRPDAKRRHRVLYDLSKRVWPELLPRTV